MREPLHAIVAGRVEARIQVGDWAPGDRLPPERELAGELGVSRATLRQALAELERRSLVTRQQGRGTFVTPARGAASPNRRALGPTRGTVGPTPGAVAPEPGAAGRTVGPAPAGDASSPAGRLRERVILVTGSTGIAAAGALRFAAEGARVFVTSRTADHCARLVVEIVERGGTADSAPAELTNEAQVEEAVDAAAARFGRLDGLFSVAGGSGRRFGDGPLHEVTLDGWRQTLDLNLTSQFLVARAVLRRMLGQDPDAAGSRGALLLVGSVLARHPVPGLFATHAYAAAKGATESLVATTAAFYAVHGIRVNEVAPGLVATPMAARAADDPATVAFAARKQPLAGGFLLPDEVARAAVYFLSDESRHVTGQVLAVDGGWSVVAAAPDH